MVRNIYNIVINALLFFFIVAVVNGVKIRGGALVAVVLAALIFGALMIASGWLLKFFKITVNFWSKLLVSVVLSFVFYFLIYNGVLGIGSIVGSVIDLGLGAGSVIRVDALGTLILVSLVSGLASAGLERLSKA